MTAAELLNAIPAPQRQHVADLAQAKATEVFGSDPGGFQEAAEHSHAAYLSVLESFAVQYKPCAADSPCDACLVLGGKS